MVLAAVLPARVAAAPVFAKTFGGHVLPNHLELTLASSAPCDEAIQAVPDGSRLVSSQFNVRVDGNGVGVFTGPVRLVRPDGSLILEARLHGTIGLGDGDDASTAPCRAPGHLEGWLDRTGPTALDPAIPQVRFTADVAPEMAGPVPFYKGTLLGLLEAPPPRPSVTVSTDKREYAPQQPIVVSVLNNGKDPLAALNGRSYCTIVQLERRVNSGWQPVGRCESFAPMPPVPLPPAQTVKATLPPDPARAPGEYRCGVTVVRPDATTARGEPLTFYSPAFTVVTTSPTLTITPNERSYGPRQPIVAVIRNGRAPARIYDEESFCTIVQLQRLDGDNWALVAGCPLARAAMPTDLKPGQTITVALPPLGATAPDWPAGRYRLAVTYTVLDTGGNPTGPAILATSEPFPVGNVFVPLSRSHAR
jgi:hypothetical protein